MKEITVGQLHKMIRENEPFQLIDVREPLEAEICNINGELIPMASIPNNLGKIKTGIPVVVHCRSGGRSGNIIQWLEQHHKFTNLHNLKGGIIAWAAEIDQSLSTY